MRERRSVEGLDFYGGLRGLWNQEYKLNSTQFLFDLIKRNRLVLGDSDLSWGRMTVFLVVLLFLCYPLRGRGWRSLFEGLVEGLVVVVAKG